MGTHLLLKGDFHGGSWSYSHQIDQSLSKKKNGTYFLVNETQPLSHTMCKKISQNGSRLICRT